MIDRILAAAAIALPMTDLSDPAQLGEMPITVITATRPSMGVSSQFQQVGIDEQQRFAAAARNARYLEATQSRHYIQRDQPDLVIDEILAMIERARGAP
ncbi:hypothetical protein Mmar10_0663 [Maricaulis maris MCS10]|uniref:Uncharacterized protein n=1 Tax=Maricaulis maris (strain MCS10) TaxID=394221 RepID=Q0ARY1_MARMM|nr:hypothetical protein [Maricaulis maris]ABI64956.1 hypothetical protein Mmar10_0663 [Maricaulis maris MCS10]